MTRRPHNHSTDPKNSALRALHATARKLGIEEEDRLDLMERVTGKRSATAMTTAELIACRQAMEGLTSKTWTPDSDPQVRKVYALWSDLKRQGKATTPRPHGFCKRMTGVDRVEWCSPEQLRQVIEGLKDWADRAAPAAPSVGTR